MRQSSGSVIRPALNSSRAKDSKARRDRSLPAAAKCVAISSGICRVTSMTPRYPGSGRESGGSPDVTSFTSGNIRGLQQAIHRCEIYISCRANSFLGFVLEQIPSSVPAPGHPDFQLHRVNVEPKKEHAETSIWQLKNNSSRIDGMRSCPALHGPAKEAASPE